MRYDLTDRLRFDEDPKLVIRDVELTVRSDAETVLRLMALLNEKGEAAGAAEAMALLLDDKDRQALARLGLRMDDWLEVLKTAVQLAMGADPEDTAPGE